MKTKLFITLVATFFLLSCAASEEAADQRVPAANPAEQSVVDVVKTTAATEEVALSGESDSTDTVEPVEEAADEIVEPTTVTDGTDSNEESAPTPTGDVITPIVVEEAEVGVEETTAIAELSDAGDETNPVSEGNLSTNDMQAEDMFQEIVGLLPSGVCNGDILDVGSLPGELDTVEDAVGPFAALVDQGMQTRTLRYENDKGDVFHLHIVGLETLEQFIEELRVCIEAYGQPEQIVQPLEDKRPFVLNELIFQEDVQQTLWQILIEFVPEIEEMLTASDLSNPSVVSDYFQDSSLYGGVLSYDSYEGARTDILAQAIDVKEDLGLPWDYADEVLVALFEQQILLSPSITHPNWIGFNIQPIQIEGETVNPEQPILLYAVIDPDVSTQFGQFPRSLRFYDCAANWLSVSVEFERELNLDSSINTYVIDSIGFPVDAAYPALTQGVTWTMPVKNVTGEYSATVYTDNAGGRFSIRYITSELPVPCP
jgi:hypothetical protein